MTMNFALPLATPEQEQHQIAAHLAAVHATPEIIICKQDTQSTNDDALALYQQGYRSAFLVSQRQSQGRGQHHRTWISSPGNIFCSALVTLERPVDGRLALECGLSLIHCDSLAGLPDLELKWANDLYSPQGKWGGILIEPINAHHLVIGIGINLLPIEQHSELPAHTSLSGLGLKAYQRPVLLSEIYLAILRALQWFNFGCHNLAERFNAVAAFRQQQVCIRRHNNPDLFGTYLGIQNDGALLLHTDATQAALACYDGRLMPHQEQR
jgi:BirA family biotin operon repressor/biotin-[acetyl-CoA-carboxylase] ligase